MLKFSQVFSEVFRGPHQRASQRQLSLSDSQWLSVPLPLLVLPLELFSAITLPFLSLVVWISLVKFRQGISLLKLEFSLYFPRISWVRS